MNIYDKRWAKVAQYAYKLKYLYKTGDYILIYDSEVCDGAEILIDENNKIFYIYCVTHGNTVIKYQLYNGDPSCDDGAHTKISDTLKQFDESIKLYQRTPIKI